MKSNYRRIGDYIQLVDERNTDLKVDFLLGLSISKEFIPSVANTIGTNMAKYKIIRKNQFSCGLMQVRRDKKIPVAQLKEFDHAIISPAYPVFEVIDSEILLPEYLMMWMMRPEFDREACFYAVGGVRGSLEWDDFCNIKLPVPHIEKQRAVVNEYNTIVNRIDLNNEIIEKLEETAQTIYRHWFVDFEFPDENGQLYKSSGGNMMWNDDLEDVFPPGWNVITVKDFCDDMKSGGTPSRNNPDYWSCADIPWLKTGEVHNNVIIATEEYISKEGLKKSSAKLLPKDTVLMSMYGVNAGELGILKIEAATNQACCGMICETQMDAAYLYYHLLHNQIDISRQSIGGAQENLNKKFIEEISIIEPHGTLRNRNELRLIVTYKELLTRENRLLEFVSRLSLSKMATIAD